MSTAQCRLTNNIALCTTTTTETGRLIRVVPFASPQTHIEGTITQAAPLINQQQVLGQFIQKKLRESTRAKKQYPHPRSEPFDDDGWPDPVGPNSGRKRWPA